MEFKVTIIKEPKAEPFDVVLTHPVTIETLVKRYGQDLPYRVIVAKQNNEVHELTQIISAPCTIQFMDIRQQEANAVYQHSLIMLYLKAIHDLMGRVVVEVTNPINKGVFTIIHTFEPLTVAQVKRIEKRMWELVHEDIPFKKEIFTRNEALNIMVDDGFSVKAKVLMADDKLNRYRFYSLNGIRNFFYSRMVPSTGYVDKFALKKYGKGVIIRIPHAYSPDKLPEYRDDKKLYKAFGEAAQWGRLMGVSYVWDLNEKIKSGEYKELILLSEALHEKKIAEIADKITRSGRRIILIAGPSSSGKTTFARRLCTQLKVNGLKPIYMGTDDYFVNRAETPLDAHGEPDFECLEAVDIELFNRNLNDLLAGKEVDLPTFDFVEGNKIFGDRVTKISKTQPIVIEGIHALNEALTPYIEREKKFKIYISPLTQLNIDGHNRISTTDARMLRRLVRDNRFRGNSAQKTIATWPKVRNGEEKYIFPYNGEADVLFNSVHIYELAVLKKYAQPLLEEIGPDEDEYSEAVRMLRFLRFFATIEDDSVIVNNSIIREFIGGSIFV